MTTISNKHPSSVPAYASPTATSEEEKVALPQTTNSEQPRRPKGVLSTLSAVSNNRPAPQQKTSLQQRVSSIRTAASKQDDRIVPVSAENRNQERKLAVPPTKYRYLKAISTSMFVASGGMFAISATSVARARNRYPDQFKENPFRTVEAYFEDFAPLNMSSVDAGKAKVLERFGDYIPVDSKCHQIKPQITGNLPAGIDGRVGHHPDGRLTLELNAFHYPGTGFHAVVHEYLHCFTNPRFTSEISYGENFREINEGITDHLADTLAENAPIKKKSYLFKVNHGQSGYFDEVMLNGKTIGPATNELINAIGEETLLRAYFQGDAVSTTKISEAAVDIFPKKISPWVWSWINNNRPQHLRGKLTECFIAAYLVLENRLPENNICLASKHLSLSKVSAMSPTQKDLLRQQGLAARERLGKTFDQAFCNFDATSSKYALVALARDLELHWQDVFKHKA